MKSLSVEYYKETNVLYPSVNEIIANFNKGFTQVFELQGKKVTFYADGVLEISGFETAPELFNDALGHRKEFVFGQYESRKLKNCVKKIILIEGVKALNDYFAVGFDNLEEVILPNSLEEIGESAFEICKKLVRFNLPNNLKVIGKRAFYSVGFEGELIISNSVEEIGVRAFACSNIKSVILPNNILKIAEGAFTYCSRLEEIEIPNNVKVIEESAFCRCSNLAKVILPKTLEKIGEYAFEGCKKLESINLCESVEVLDYAFSNSGYEKVIFEKECLNIPIISWEKEFGEVLNENQLTEKFFGKEIIEQAKLLTAKITQISQKYSYGKLDSSITNDKKEKVSKLVGVTKFIVKNGVLVGVEYENKIVLVGKEVTLYSASETDGTGESSLTENIIIEF